MIQMIFTLMLLCATVARGAIVQRPKNQAVSVGGSSYFNCSNNDNRPIDWVFSPDGNPDSTGITMTDNSCNIVANYSGHFRTEKSNSNVCNLIVFNATLQLGGYYACDSGVGSDSKFQGILVVADTNSTITNNVTEVIEGCEDDVFFELTVKYSGPLPVAPTPPSSIALPPLYPSLKWTLKLDPANTIPSSETPTNTTSSSHLMVTAKTPSVPSYVCTLYFKTPTNPPQYCDITAPSFTFDWETPQINTFCNALDASSISVTSYIESGICEAKILECHPYAYPPPHDVHWLDVIRNEVVNGTRITAEFGGEYVCSVTNAINGTNHTVNVTYKLNDDIASTMGKCKGITEVNVTVSMNNRSDIISAETRKGISLQSNSNAYSSHNVTGNAAEAVMTCTADGIPKPTYTWYSSDCQSPISNDQQIKVFASSSYECVARNSINDRKFSKNITIEITLSGAELVICDYLEPVETSDECWQCLLLLILLVLVFLLPACIFLLCYGCSKSCRENVNEKFLWIEKALPCMNEKGCKCSGGMVLFIFCLVICGIIFVPWILIASHCCRKNSKKSQIFPTPNTNEKEPEKRMITSQADAQRQHQSPRKKRKQKRSSPERGVNGGSPQPGTPAETKLNAANSSRPLPQLTRKLPPLKTSSSKQKGDEFFFSR